MLPNLKVKVNETETSLFIANNDIQDLKYVDLKKRPPIAYHYLYYDIQTDTTYSSDLNESNRVRLNQHLFRRGFYYRYENEWEMVYLRSGPYSTLLWSWEFDTSFGISSLVFDCSFFSFHIDTVNWYIFKEKPIYNNRMDLTKAGILLPFNTVKKSVIFDKEVDVTEYIRGSSSVYIVCDLPNSDSAVHLFRSRALGYKDIPPFNNNPNNYQHKHKYPFNVHVKLTPKSNNSNNNSNNSNKSNNSNNSSNQINNNSYQYYFIEKYPGLKSPIELESWSSERLQYWLSDLLLFEFVEYFKKNHIDGKALMTMDLESIFKPLGIEDYRIAKLKKCVGRIKSFGEKKETLYKVDKKMIVSNTILYLKKTSTELGKWLRDDCKIDRLQTNNGGKDQAKYSINDDKSDFKIIVQGKEINVHRAKLSKIEYFRVLFNSDFKENKDNYSKFDDEDYATFKSLLEILYLPNEEKVGYFKSLDPIQLKDILLLSNRLLFNKLEFMVENFILWNVTQENAQDVYNGFPENGSIQSFTEYYLKNIKNQSI